MGKLCGGQGPTEKVALSFRTVLGLKERALFLRFDALGNYLVLEALSHANDGAYDWRVIGIASDPLDEGLVNFQDINGKLLKIAEAGIAGAKVIHRKVNPHLFELLKYSGRGFGMVHKDAFGKLDNAVLVPLTNGVQLYVTDCARMHLWVVSSVPANSKPPDLPASLTPMPPVTSGSRRFERILPGSTNGSDCVFFTSQFQDLGGHPLAVPLGDVNQIAIEEKYWTAYSKAKSQHRIGNMMAAGVLSLWGFPAGIIVWLFYRLIRFAVKG
jgi:hypothetical protein